MYYNISLQSQKYTSTINTRIEFCNGKLLQSFWPTTTKWMSSVQYNNKTSVSYKLNT